MPSQQQRDRRIARIAKNASTLDRVSDRIFRTIDSAYDDKRLLNSQNSGFQAIIDRQLNMAKGVASGDIVDFIAALKVQNHGSMVAMRQTAGPLDATDLFTENIGDIFGYFQDIYKNRYLEVSDLKFISKFVPSLGEAVKTTLDSIVTSDDVSESITRNLVLENVVDEQVSKPIIAEIERMEDEYKLLRKLKNIAYNKTLVTGTYYVYCIGYKELFEDYSTGVKNGKYTRKDQAGMYMQGNVRLPKRKAGKNNAPKGGNTDRNPLGLPGSESILITDISSEPALEAFGEEASTLVNHRQIRKCSLSDAMESTFKDIKSFAQKSATKNIGKGATSITGSVTGDQLVKAVESDLPCIYFCDSDIPFEAMQDADSLMAIEGAYEDIFGNNASSSMKAAEKKLQEIADGGADGTYDPNDVSHRSGEKFDVSGTYLKWIDYKYIIPVEILGKTVGYYHVLTTKKAKTNLGGSGSILSNSTMNLFSQVNVTEQKKEEAIQSIVSSISNAILDQFGAKFVRKNAAFKQLIADCIIANGLCNNDYMIQFIPADKIVVFKVNEDEQGHGESILQNSLFPAHLLLSLLVCKELNYINKSGNKTIAHISNGGIDESNVNQIQRIIRNLQEANVTFNDLLSTNLVFSKFARDSNLAMPKDRQGQRLVEFEVQEGQQIELNTEFENKLEQMAIMGTGVPSVIMEYLGNVDVAKEIVSANIKFAGRVANLQADLEEPTTELYKKILMNSNLTDDQKNLINTSFKFKLPRPRILANANNVDAISSLQSMAQMIADIMVGQNSTDEDAPLVKDELIKIIVEEEAPFFDKTKYDKRLAEARIRVKAAQTKKVTGTENGEGGDLGGGGLDTGGGDLGEF